MNDQTCTIRGVTLGEGMPKICIPLTGRTAEALRRECAALKDYPFDLIEWRADFLRNLSEREDALAALRDCLPDAPLLGTFRTAREGGEMPLSEAEYFSFVRWMIHTGKLDAVDLEYFHDEAERDALRQEYLNAIMRNARKVLENTYIVDEKGNKRKLQGKGFKS